jgi:imidazolonepropionase-like amidohydrolase
VYVLEQDGGFSRATNVVVEDGLVTAVADGARGPAGAPEYDMRGLWLMPGVFDCHTHVGLSSTDRGELLETAESYAVLETAVNLRRVLDAGVTFARDLGSVDAGVRKAVDDGLVPGPRLQVAIRLLSQTAGHGDMYSPRIGVEPDPVWRFLMTTADGVDGVRLETRRLLRDGADWIKLCTSGGVVSPHDSPFDVSFTRDEIAVAVAEAGHRRRSVAVHATCGRGIDNAVAAGVRSVEHGTLLSEEQAAAMAAAGCWLVPTLSVLRELIDEAEKASGDGFAPLYALDKVLELRDRFGDCVRVSRAAGVRIAMGCDWIDRRQHGRNLEELALLHEAGMPAEEVLLAATAEGAELCGVGDRLGRIAPGFVFDAVVLGEDPSDMTVFRRPEAVLEVFKAGVACRTGAVVLRERASRATGRTGGA